MQLGEIHEHETAKVTDPRRLPKQASESAHETERIPILGASRVKLVDTAANANWVI